MKKKTLIYGGGAIGSYLAACLLNSKHQIFLTRKKNYNYIERKGLTIKVFNNKKLKKFSFKRNKNFILVKNLKKIKNIQFDNIFITTKINVNLEKIFYDIEKFIDQRTLIITMHIYSFLVA